MWSDDRVRRAGVSWKANVCANQAEAEGLQVPACSARGIQSPNLRRTCALHEFNHHANLSVSGP